MAERSLSALRRILGALFLVGLVGTGTELLLLEHTEGPWQLSPLCALGAGILALGWRAVSGSRTSLRVFRALMFLYLAIGTLGLYLHYDGNAEFELEMTPSIEGWELFREAVTGATPALAPGTMIFLGLLGLASTYGTSFGDPA